MTLDDLANAALVGTGRAAPPSPPADDGALGRTFAALAGGTPEDQLLGAAAILSAYETCGAAAGTDDHAVDPAPADARPACSPRAAALLDQLLAMPNAPTKLHLVTEWLAGANAVGRRASHASIATLLEYGTSSRAIREAIADVADQRGRWLMALNARWQFAAGDDVDAAAIWSTGNREQRAGALRSRRAVDPSAARRLVESTWTEDGADERAAFVEAMGVGLSADDEPFLEAALDDRSKLVRAAAASSLATLPASAFVGRMVERLSPLLTFRPGEPGRLLRKAKPAALEIALPPDEFDASWARDNITDKPPGRVGRRQYWLQQFIASVPPALWSARWQATPADVLAALSGDFVALIREGLAAAALRTRDAGWIVALLESDVANDGKQPLPLELLGALPAASQSAALTRRLESPRLDVAALTALLAAGDFEWPADAARAALARIEAHARQANTYDHQLPGLLDRAALRLPPDAALEAAATWSGDGWEPNRKPLESFHQTLQLRRDIRREFPR